MILEWNRQKDEDPCIYSKRHRTETLRVTLFFASWDVPMVPFPLDFHTWCLGTEPGAQRCAEHSRASGDLLQRSAELHGFPVGLSGGLTRTDACCGQRILATTKGQSG